MSRKGWDGKIQKDEFVQLQEASAQVMGMDALLFNGSNIQEFIDYLKSSLMEKYPNMFFKIVKAPLSNDDELTIYGSLDPKESWSNKIFENSNYFILNVDNKGYMWKTLTSLYRKGMKYHIDGRVKVNFPKQKAKNREDMLRRLTVFIDNADASVNESKVRKESAMNMNLYHASREIEHFMRKYSDPSPENFIELAKSLASRLGFKNADQRKIDELAFHLNNEWDYFTRVKAVDIGDLERIISYLMDRNVKENSDQSTAKARSEWADLKLAEELFPETATLDRYLHVANILHATGLYKEEAEALSRARTKLNLKDPEYSKKLDYIKNMEKWNIKAMKDRGIGERQIKESILIKGDGHNVSIANRFWNEWNNIKDQKDQDAWEKKVGLTRFGSYLTDTLNDIIERFQDDLDLSSANKITVNDFIREIDRAINKYNKPEYRDQIVKAEQSKKKVVDESQRMATNIDEIKQWFADRGYEISDTVRGKDKNGVYYVIFTRDEIRDEDMPDLRMWENYSVSMGDKNMRNTRGIAHVFYIPSEPVDGVAN